LSDLAKYSMKRSSRGLSATAELLVPTVTQITNIVTSCQTQATKNVYRGENGLTTGRRDLKQEAQLLQGGCALLHVIEYFAKSLNVIRNDTVEWGVCKSL